MSAVPELSPQELRSELDSGKELFLLDVREDHELAISSLPNIVHIRLDDITTRFSELPKDADIVIICRSGARSGRATEFLLSQGFSKVRNLATGMNGYATTVDTTMETY